MTTDTFKNYTQRVGDGDFPILGYLFWYSVPEATRVDHDNLVKLLDANGLDAYKPPIPKDKNVFLRVASSHQRKRVPTADPDIYENYMVRSVIDDGDRAIKQIVVERVDSAGEKLSHTAAVQIKFDNGEIEISHLTPTPDDFQQAEAVAELIERDYNAERNKVNAYGVRELIRKIVLNSGATTVRPSGGVYFLMEAKADIIAAMQAVADSIHYVEVHPVPLIDDGRQREMLRKAIEAETIDTIDETLAKLDEIDTVTARKYGTITSEMNSIKSRTKEYAELLEDALEGVNFRLKVYEAKVKQLFTDGKVQ